MARFRSPYPSPTGLRRELLETLAEECAEVIKRCTKAMRFGLEEIQPGQEYSNARRIALEVGDVYEVVNRLEALSVLHPEDIMTGIKSKQRQLAEFIQHDK